MKNSLIFVKVAKFIFFDNNFTDSQFYVGVYFKREIS